MAVTVDGKVAQDAENAAAAIEKRAREAQETLTKAEKAMTDTVKKAEESIANAEKRARESDFKALLTEKLAGTKLRAETRERVRESFVGPKGVVLQIVDEAAIDAAIAKEVAYLHKVAESNGAGRITGCGSVEITVDQRDRHQAAMDGFFSGEDEPVGAKAPTIPLDAGRFSMAKGRQFAKESASVGSADRQPRFRSFQNAIETICNGGRRMSAFEMLRACSGWQPGDSMAADAGRAKESMSAGRMRAKESLGVSDFSLVLGDSITRQLLKAYVLENRVQILKTIASSVQGIKDFRTQRRDRIGGYGKLPVVAEKGTYEPLTSPSNEEATYTIAKYGGTEDITLEMMAADDVGAISRIPGALALAAAETIWQGVLDTPPANSTLTYDSAAMFRTANCTTSAVSRATMLAARKAMRQTAPYGDTTKRLGAGNIPKYFLIPSDLEELAMRYAKSGVLVQDANFNATETPNIWAGLVYFVIDYWSSASKAFLIADPQKINTLELGFFNGQEEPELQVQDMANVGSMFNADKITWKIRHIWGALFPDRKSWYAFSTTAA